MPASAARSVNVPSPLFMYSRSGSVPPDGTNRSCQPSRSKSPTAPPALVTECPWMVGVCGQRSPLRSGQSAGSLAQVASTMELGTAPTWPAPSVAGSPSSRSAARSGSSSVPNSSTAQPPSTATAQVPPAYTATPRRPSALASARKVTGPAAAAANSRAAAGAVPAPRISSSATSGISNSNGTLISTPSVAAMTTPSRLSPR